MNGNTVFQNPAEQSQNQETPVQNTASQTREPPQSSSDNPSFVFHANSSSAPFGKILKVIIGIIVLIIIGIVIFTIVIPKFQNSQVGKVTLEYWGLWEDEPVMNSAITEFNSKYPDITIKYSKQNIKQYRERLSARIKNGTGPDIFRFHNTWIQMFSEDLMPLPSDTINKDDFNKWYYPVMQKDLIKNGAIYGVPLGIDTLALYINTDIFKSAGLSVPDNWVDFINYARSLTVSDENGNIKTAGAALGTFNNITHAPDIVSLLFVQSGVDLNNFKDSFREAEEALAFYTSFSQTSRGSGTWDSNLDASIISFSKGSLAMYFGYSWDYFTIKAINPDLAFEIHPVPHLPNENMTISSYWAQGVSSKSKNQKEALLFMKFLSAKETEQKIFTEAAKTRAFGQPYANTELAATLKDNPDIYPFVLQAKDSESSFFASDTFDNGLNFQMNTYLGDAVNAILGSSSPQTAVNTLSQGVDQVLLQYSPKPAK